MARFLNAQFLFQAGSTEGTEVKVAGEINTISRHKHCEPVLRTEVVQTLLFYCQKVDDADGPQRPVSTPSSLECSTVVTNSKISLTPSPRTRLSPTWLLVSWFEER